MMQCFKKFYNKPKVKLNFLNGCKYFSKLLPGFILAVTFGNNTKKQGSEHFTKWFYAKLFATFFSLFWDNYVDWGLFRSRNWKTYALRDRIKYPQGFYYFAIVLNFSARFYWLFGLSKWAAEDYFKGPLSNFEFLALVGMMAEAFRRTVWGIIRVENEQNNNFEAYRTIPNIPDLVDVGAKIDW